LSSPTRLFVPWIFSVSAPAVRFEKVTVLAVVLNVGVAVEVDRLAGQAAPHFARAAAVAR